MKLIIFDIDGTILDSVGTDDRCYIQTMRDLYDIDLTNVDWSKFKNVTDAGLTYDIFEETLNREPSTEDIASIKFRYKSLIKGNINELSEIENALSFIEQISDNSEYEIGFATGGWKETAEVKCSAIELKVNDFIFRNSNDHYSRAKITELVIEEGLRRNSLEKFEKVIYFGDGLWDYKTTKEIDIDFIGVDYHSNHKLKDAGVDKIIKDYKEPSQILKWIDEETSN